VTGGGWVGVSGGKMLFAPAPVSVGAPSPVTSMLLCANNPPLTRFSSTIA
jgi:hypothetical protein